MSVETNTLEEVKVRNVNDKTRAFIKELIRYYSEIDYDVCGLAGISTSEGSYSKRSCDDEIVSCEYSDRIQGPVPWKAEFCDIESIPQWYSYNFRITLEPDGTDLCGGLCREFLDNFTKEIGEQKQFLNSAFAPRFYILLCISYWKSIPMFIPSLPAAAAPSHHPDS